MLELENVEDIFNFTWGEDMAVAVWQMLNNKTPEEYTIINPNSCSLYDFAAEACKVAGLSPESNIIRKVSNRIGQPKIGINNLFFWSPIFNYTDIAREMVNFDIINYKNEK